MKLSDAIFVVFQRRSICVGDGCTTRTSPRHRRSRLTTHVTCEHGCATEVDYDVAQATDQWLCCLQITKTICITHLHEKNYTILKIYVIFT